MMMLRNYYSKVEYGRRYGIMVEHHRWCGLPDVRMMMSRNYYSKVDDEVSCEYCEMFA
jgi:hypothetical protein